MNIDTKLMAQAQAGVASASNDLPDPPAKLVHKDIKYYEVSGPYGEPLLLAFGLVPLTDWLELVNGYYDQAPADAGLGDKPWDPEDPEKVVAALDRLHYERLSVVVHPDSEEEPFTVQWGTEGTVPVTVWVIDFEAPDEDREQDE